MSFVLVAMLVLCGFSVLPAQAASNVGSGGTVTYTDANGVNPRSSLPYVGGYVVHTFIATGTTTFTVPAEAGTLDIEYLLVGGGGSGGSGYGGGGGAGGLLTNVGGLPLPIEAGTYTVVIGAGGAGVSAASPGNPGATSSAFGLTAYGGGGGGSSGNDGGSGGSGGGASKVHNVSVITSGGVSSPGQGQDGGLGVGTLTTSGGGGGGGAGGAGGAITGTNLGGAGGGGIQNSISGSNVYYAAGGSGVFNSTSASGIGGTCESGVAAGSGVPNTGSGGGGFTGTGTGSGAGGSGVAIIRYRYVAEVPLLVRVTAPANGKGFYLDVPVTVTATVANGTAPYTVCFYTNFNGGAFACVTATDNVDPYTVDLGTPPAGTHGIYAVVTNALLTATSPTNFFTVATNNLAVGGTITYTDSQGLNPRSAPPYVGGHVVHTFGIPGTAVFTVPSVADGLTIEYLIVGGGGSGGSGYGGGGGAGGLRTNVGGTPQAVPAGAHAIIVGGGGSGVSTAGLGNPGGASSAFGVKANGGGAGGGGYTSSQSGGAGGSGGGSCVGGTLGGPGNAGHGNRGGTTASDVLAGAGGGGAGAAGGSPTVMDGGGAGGGGVQNGISGSNIYYAAGGSGVFNSTSSSGIGGTCQSGQPAGAGAANTGAGGGANTGTGARSGAGGTGAVIVRYAYTTVEKTVAAPAFDPPPGSYVGATSVTLRCATPEAVIHYTTDGTIPTGGSSVYTHAITIPLGTSITLKALGVKTGYADSDIASASYSTISSRTWVNPSGGSWPVPANWLNNIVCQGSDLPAKFDTLTLAANATVTLDGARTVGGLAFADAGDVYTWTLDTGSGGPLTLEAAAIPEINVSNRTATIMASLAGTNGLKKTGVGTLVCRGANTLNGGVTIAAGTLDYQVVPPASLGMMTILADGTAMFHGTYLGYGYTVKNDFEGDGFITVKSTAGSGSAGYVRLWAGLSGFTGTITFDTTLNYGELSSAKECDGKGARWVVNRSGGSCYLSTGEAGTYRLGELSGNGALGAYYIWGTTTWEVGTLDTDSTYSGVIVDAVSPGRGIAALKKVGAGKLTLTKACAFSGGTVVSGGILEVIAGASLGRGNVEVVGGKLSLQGSGKIDALDDASPLRLPKGGTTLELAADETVGALYIGGVAKQAGTWGAVGNTRATHTTGSLTGTGILTVVKGSEPLGTVIMLCGRREAVQVTVTDPPFRAVGDYTGSNGTGGTNNRQALQAAIDYAGRNGGGTVVIPPGKFRTASLFLRSGVTVYLKDGAELITSQVGADYVADDGTPLNPVRSHFLNNGIPWYSSSLQYPGLLYIGEGVHDVTITGDGKGVIRGNSLELPCCPDVYSPSHIHMNLVQAQNARSFVIENVHLLQTWHTTVVIAGCTDGIIRNVYCGPSGDIAADFCWLANSSNLLVENNRLYTSDDGVVIWTVRGEARLSKFFNAQTAAPCVNIVVRNNYINTNRGPSAGTGWGVVFYRWGAAVRDPDDTKISTISVYDNLIDTRGSAGLPAYSDGPWDTQWYHDNSGAQQLAPYSSDRLVSVMENVHFRSNSVFVASLFPRPRAATWVTDCDAEGDRLMQQSKTSDNLGTRFAVKTDGAISKVRFLSAEKGNHTVTLYRVLEDGTAAVIMSPNVWNVEMANFMVEYVLPAPVPVSAGSDYIVAVSTGTGGSYYYAEHRGYRMISDVGGHVVNKGGVRATTQTGTFTQPNGEYYFREIVFKADAPEQAMSK